METSLNNSNLNKPKKWLKKSISLYLAIVLIITSFAVGLSVGKSGNIKVVTNAGNVQTENGTYGKVAGKSDALPEYLQKDVDFGLFWDVWEKIQNEYVDHPTGETQLLYGAISGLVSSLDDPYSVFFPPEPAKEFTDDLSGKFEGIGAEIGIRDNLLTVISPLSESPAESAGLKARDRILEIDGYKTDSLSLNEAVQRIRGEKGTTVTLKIYREKDNNYHEIKITRDVIKIVSVKYEMKEGNIAYIQITNFNQDTLSRFKSAVDEVILQNPKGIILDLRSNPGGYLSTAVDISSYWVDPGKVVVKEEFSEDEVQDYTANGSAQLKNYPTIVLVNGGSASASEIVSGALQDYGLAKLVGEKTFGKGSVQNLEELSDGSAVKLTIARWLTPNDRQIDVVGIDPDEVVEMTEDDYNNNLDPQLDKALELLK